MAEEEDRKWTVLRLRGLRKRWIVNTILPVLVLLVLLVTLVSAGRFHLLLQQHAETA